MGPALELHENDYDVRLTPNVRRPRINRPVEDWGKILGDTAATSAIPDRFLDKVLILPFKGKSYRLNRPK